MVVTNTRFAELLQVCRRTTVIRTRLRTLLEANRELRHVEWPEPYNHTAHTLRLGDARELGFLDDQSVHLVVTSPPYWTLKEYNDHPGPDGSDRGLRALPRRVGQGMAPLLPGAGAGRAGLLRGGGCLHRPEQAGRHYVMPLHADIQVRVAKPWGSTCSRRFCGRRSPTASWSRRGTAAGFYGKPYQPGAIIKNDVEHVLFFRKGGKYRSVPPVVKVLSMLSKAEMQTWFRSIWTDVPGASTAKHPAPYPVELASRLIRMFSFAGDTVLDPFAGTGTTLIAAMQTGPQLDRRRARPGLRARRGRPAASGELLAAARHRGDGSIVVR